jgi:3' terminal RNA ribose 2'-O-methyltransferase Hen1
VLLEITTTHYPATDLGFLLNKHPDRLQSVELAIGKAHVFYREANNAVCTACLLLDINPIDLVRTRGQMAFLQQHYVNDRPYTANSFLSTAMVKAFGSAMNGTAKGKPELVDAPLPLKAALYSLTADCDPSFINKLLEPLGYNITVETLPLDERFSSWGLSKAVNLTVEKTTTVQELLSQLYVFILALDNDRHYWISRTDIDTLLRRGEGWLQDHPEKEWITKRFLKNLRTYTSQALLRLAGEEALEEADTRSKEWVSLHEQRLQKAYEFIKQSGAATVLDLGCGEGKLMKKLIRDSRFKRIVGMDVSFSELQKAKENLFLDTASPLMRERIALFQGSVTYKDDRMKGFDAAALVEVIEHLDEERLPSMERVVFGSAGPTTVVLSTPNAEHNSVYERLNADAFRHEDHRFEWTREQFKQWCAKVCAQFNYEVAIYPVGEEAPGVGAPSQMAVFKKKQE